MAYLQLKALAASRDKERILAMILELMQINLNFNDFEIRNIFESLIVYSYDLFGDNNRLDKELNKLPPSKNKTVMKSIAQQLMEKGEQKGQIKVATNLIKTTNLSDAEIAKATELEIDQVIALRKEPLNK